MALSIDGSKKQSPARRQPYGASDQTLTKTELERWLPQFYPWRRGPLSLKQVIGAAAAKLDTYGWYSEGVERVAPIWSTSPLVNPQFHHRLPENAQVTVKTIVPILAALFVFVLSRRRLGVVPGLIAGALVLAAWVFEGVRHG
jgi:hypothetical protein